MSTTERTGHRWLQINVALCRPDGGGALVSARAVFGRLEPMLADWRAEGAVDGFHFMRKPPDLRLRFGGPDPAATLTPDLTAALGELRARGAVERFFASIYEPEERLFGGPAAMALVHAHFDADTTAWLALDRLRQAGSARLPVDLLACAIVNDLCARRLDANEIWDVWCNLATIVGVAPPASAAPPGERVRLGDGLRAAASEDERALLDDYRDANAALAGGLGELWSAGRLECGVRALLTYVALFCLHRHGLDGARQAALAEAMRRAWDPRGRFRGDDAGRATSST